MNRIKPTLLILFPEWGPCSDRADRAWQLSSTSVLGARQRSTLNFDGVNDRLVMVCFAVGCNLRSLIPTQVGGSFSVSVRGSVWLGHEVSCVLSGPTSRTFSSCWNHDSRWPTYTKRYTYFFGKVVWTVCSLVIEVHVETFTGKDVGPVAVRLDLAA